MTYPPSPLAIEPLSPQRSSVAASGAHFRWPIPGSKSITNRALVLAALADGTSRLEGVLQSDDTRHMRAALEALGIGVREIDATTWEVDGGVARLRAPSKPLFIGNSGTTVRFLTALAALVPGSVTLEGDEHMAKRPIADLVEGLSQVGVRIDCPTGCPPLTVHGGTLAPPESGRGVISMRGDRSSQYFSAALMAAPLARQALTLEIEGHLVSRPYVDITCTMMRAFGAEVESSDAAFHVRRGQYAPLRYVIEPDASAASYAFAAAAATGVSVTVDGLGHDALQGDYGFVDLLERAGAKVERGATSTRVTGTGPLRGLDVDMHHISDTVMTLAALAPLASGPTTIRNVANIRIKETDRLEATVNELRRLGQEVTSGEDWLRIDPRPIRPATVHCYSDHRMAMSFAVLGLAHPGVSIEDPTCVAKTYPGYWDDLRLLYQAVGRAAPFETERLDLSPPSN